MTVHRTHLVNRILRWRATLLRAVGETEKKYQPLAVGSNAPEMFPQSRTVKRDRDLKNRTGSDAMIRRPRKALPKVH